MFSRYLRIKKRDGVVAVFHELHPNPVFCSESEWEKCDVPLMDRLTERGLVVLSPEDDDRAFENARTRLETKLNRATILYLMMAQGCNFSCKYCPVPEMAKKYGEALLSHEDARAGIDLWQEHIKDANSPDHEYFLIFYGGEPLLNKPVIKSAVEYVATKQVAGDLPKNVHMMIATNGSLIDDAIIALCKEHNISVAVGLDGPKPSNDLLKVYNDGAGTFDRIVKTIRTLVANGIQTFASVSITPANIAQIGHYGDFFRELGVEKFGFNFLKGHLLLQFVPREQLEDYYRNASRGIIENARHQHKPGFEYQIGKKQHAFDTEDFFPVDCTCYGNQLVIQPDGEISNCPFFKARLGQVREVAGDFRIWNQAIVQEWRARLPLFHPGEAKAISGGGCAWSSSELSGSPIAPDQSSHIFSEEVLDELIWSRYRRGWSR